MGDDDLDPTKDAVSEEEELDENGIPKIPEEEEEDEEDDLM